MSTGDLSNNDLTVANRIAEVTGEDASEYSAEGYPMPDFDDLEFHDATEYYGDE